MNDQPNFIRLGILVSCGDAAHDEAVIAAIRREFNYPQLTLANFDKLMLAGGTHLMREKEGGIMEAKIQALAADAVTYQALHNVNLVVIAIPAGCGAYGGQPVVTEEQRSDAAKLSCVFYELGFQIMVLEAPMLTYPEDEIEMRRRLA